MNEELNDALDDYLRGKVNDCVAGIFDRLGRIENVCSTQAEQIWKEQARVTSLTATVDALTKDLAEVRVNTIIMSKQAEGLTRQAAGHQSMIEKYGEQIGKLGGNLAETQINAAPPPKPRTLNLVELRTLAHHGYLMLPINAMPPNAEADAYDKLLNLKLIESASDAGRAYRTTARGYAFLTALQMVPVLEDV